MALRKSSKIDLSRLCQAVQRSRLALQRPREQRAKIVEAFAGPNWGAERQQSSRPINLLAQYVQVVGRNLVAKDPRFMLSTFSPECKPVVSAMQTWANQEVRNMRLQQTLQRVVLDALICVGTLKVAIASPADSAAVGWDLKAGSAFAERVSFDDLVFDVHARDFREVTFIGHRFRAPLSVVKEAKIYSARRKDLSASIDLDHNADGDVKASALGRGPWSADPTEFEDHVTLWEIYLPRHGIVITVDDDQVTGGGAADQGVEDALRVQRWLGPPCGPYHMLSLGVVPDNILPKAPMMDLYDLDDFANQSLRKIMRQTNRYKEVFPVKGASDADMARLEGTDDGFAFKCDYDAPKPVAYGGASQVVLGAFMQAKALFNEAAGNLALLSGAAPQSATASQDKMLNENASAGVVDMQQTTVQFVSDVGRALAWFWYHDPEKVMRAPYQVPGVPEVSTVREVGPADRYAGKWDEIDVKVDPYSLRHSTPEARASELTQLVMQVIAPLMPVLERQGIALDLNTFLKKIGEYTDQPDLSEIVTLREPPPAAGGAGGGEAPGMPSATTRNYVRESVSEKTPAGQEAMTINNLMSGKDEGGASAAA